ncbi:hypothetical protein LTR86_008549 [Recurvomyces mirabilis]|nr:hypothetical protein LTR86_008549 [Recurvomyces mirabilis]
MAASEDDAELKAAIAMSLAENDQATKSSDGTTGGTSDTSNASISAPAQAAESMGLAGIDRAAMERERLARQATRKRERPITPPSPRKAPKLETTSVDLPSGARLNMFSTLVDQDQAGRKSSVAQAANAPLKAEPDMKADESKSQSMAAAGSQGGLIYPNGVVKKTWAFGHERTGDDIKLEEVLEPLSVRTAVLSAFQWDTDWVLSKLKVPKNGGNTKCVFVMQAKDEALKQEMLEQSEGMRPFLRLCFPPMDGQIHCMHSKLMLLFHKQKLRVAIPTANLLNFDWGETGVMENSVFIIDLPRLDEEVKATKDGLTDFGCELMHFLEKQGMYQDVMDGVLKFDFSATRDIAFVHTIGGIMYGDEAKRTGLPGLGRAVRQLGLQAEDLEIDFAASSIGSLNDDYLRALHAAAKGEDMLGRADAAASTAKATFFSKGSSKLPPEKIRDKIRIYFPTHETVTSSTAGSAGTICLSRKWWENMPFPRSVFRDYISTRFGLLSHNKILYARGKRKSTDGSKDEDVAWVYVGSANMSESAWGKLVHDKKVKAWRINCRNWECGVLLPVPKEKLGGVVKAEEKPVAVKEEKVEGEDSETESEDETKHEDSETESEDEAESGLPDVDGTKQPLVGMNVFNGLVTPPFKTPGKEFGDREPWYFMESHDR